MSKSQDKNIEVTLFRGFPPYKKIVWSPFVTKVELRLRHAQAKHKLECGMPGAGPKGKIPYVHITPNPDPSSSEPTLKLGDSSAIIKYLAEIGYVPDLNKDLSPAQKLADAGVRAICEEKLYFLAASERWTENYYTQRDGVMGMIPWPMRVIIGNMAYRKTVATLYGQGTGRHSTEENRASRQEIWGHFDAALASPRKEATSSKPFWILGGDEPTEADFTLFGFISSTLLATSGPDSREIVVALPNLMDYTDRIWTTYFSEYEKW